ncbi:MAG: peptidylprolyl isomerase [Candidatus Omnitrophica bacterium]|nr:peptidylprolyl isomerase [Candidatus Omnitrophota bacterium]
MKNLSPAARSAIGDDRRRLLEEMVLETVLFQEARKRGMDREPQVRELVAEARRQIMIGRLMEKEGEQSPPVTDQEIVEYYEQRKAQFAQPERWRASHILVSTEAQAKEALERLGKGERFERVAEALSQDTSKSKGGDLGYFSRGQLIPEFEEAATQLQVGQTSGVIKTSLGHHVISLTDHQAAQQRGLGDVRDQITQELKNRRARARSDQFVNELRKQARVFIRDNETPPSAPEPADVPEAAPVAPSAAR